MKKSTYYILFSFFAVVLLTNCKKDDDEDGGGINIFSIEDDKEFGRQMSEYLDDSLATSILDSTQYASAYSYLYDIRNYILNSPEIRYKDVFPYRIRIIKDDATLNAFATPGGYIYVYTGIIKYLDYEDHLAGVLAHEIAHSDRRHSTEQLTKQYGIQTLLDIVLGKNQGVISQVATGLVGLKFSREHEEDADNYSVRYLCQSPAKYEADGAGGFFSKLIAEEQGGGTPEFLSTHPNPDNRITNIQDRATTLGCDTTLKAPSTYATFKSSLP